MSIIAVAAALVAAAIHVWFFTMESLRWEQPSVWRRFGLHSDEQAQVVRPMAFNQGFYNLFLALGIVAGLGLVATGNVAAGEAIVAFACACMIGAGLVLFASNRRFLLGAAIQALPPLVAVIAIVIL